MAGQHAKQKIDRSILLELDAVADAVGSVQQHANAQRQIGLLTEVTDFLEKLIVPNLEVSLIELGDQLVAAVLQSEKHIEQVYHPNNRFIPLFSPPLLLPPRPPRTPTLPLP